MKSTYLQKNQGQIEKDLSRSQLNTLHFRAGSSLIKLFKHFYFVLLNNNSVEIQRALKLPQLRETIQSDYVHFIAQFAKRISRP